MEEREIVQYNLDPKYELRFSVDDPFSQPEGIGLQLTDGRAEIFGTIMEKYKIYWFPSFSSVAVFTWHGCSLKIIGKPSEVVIEKERNKNFRALHVCLEKRRIIADRENKRGPVTLVVGPKDSGKSTLCKFLLNYAVRLGHRPVLIDLDVGQHALSLPGTVNLLKITEPSDIVKGFAKSDIKASGHFGYKKPSEMLYLYFLLIKILGRSVKISMREERVKSSGIIIDTCGCIMTPDLTCNKGYQAIIYAAKVFEIDKLVVIGEDHLYLKLKKDMRSSVEVLYMPKIIGIPEMPSWTKIYLQMKMVTEYFYGFNSLEPYRFEVRYQDLKILKIERKNLRQKHTVPVTFDNICFTEVPFGFALLNHLFALCLSVDDPEIAAINITGYICITNIKVDDETVTIISPNPEPLRTNILLFSNIELV